MPATAITRRPPARILVVGRPAGNAQFPWPDPLPKLLAENLLLLKCSPNPFDAAAQLHLPGADPYAALLVDPEELSRGELQMMATVKRHVVLPIWSLPSHNRTALLRDLGILPWEDAIRALIPILLHVYTPNVAEGNTLISHPVSAAPPPPSPPHLATPSTHTLPAPSPTIPPLPAKPHNAPNSNPEKRVEIPVVSRVADRYDEHVNMPLLTEHEIRALLGPADEGSPQ